MLTLDRVTTCPTAQKKRLLHEHSRNIVLGSWFLVLRPWSFDCRIRKCLSHQSVSTGSGSDRVSTYVHSRWQGGHSNTPKTAMRFIRPGISLMFETRSLPFPVLTETIKKRRDSYSRGKNPMQGETSEFHSTNVHTFIKICPLPKTSAQISFI